MIMAPQQPATIRPPRPASSLHNEPARVQRASRMPQSDAAVRLAPQSSPPRPPAPAAALAMIPIQRMRHFTVRAPVRLEFRGLQLSVRDRRKRDEALAPQARVEHIAPAGGEPALQANSRSRFKEILHGISARFEPGELIAVMGDSGKTTSSLLGCANL